MAENDYEIKLKFTPELGGRLGGGSPQTGAKGAEDAMEDTAKVMKGLVKPVMSLMLTGRLGFGPQQLTNVLTSALMNPAIWKIAGLGIAAAGALAGGAALGGMAADKLLEVLEQKREDEVTRQVEQPSPFEFLGQRSNVVSPAFKERTGIFSIKEMEEMGITMEELRKEAGSMGIVMEESGDYVKILEGNIVSTDTILQQLQKDISIGITTHELWNVTIENSVANLRGENDTLALNTKARNENAEATLRQLNVQKDLQRTLGKRGTTIANRAGGAGAVVLEGAPDIGLSAGFMDKIREINAG